MGTLGNFTDILHKVLDLPVCFRPKWSNLAISESFFFQKSYECIAMKQLFTISTSRYREYASSTTKTSSPVGNGPHILADTWTHGPFGGGDIFNGSRVALLRHARQGKQSANRFSTCLSVPGNHTLDRNNCLVFTMPM